MKFAQSLLLLAATTQAVQLKTKAEMEAEVTAMSMNSNMHQVNLREKTLLKTYLEVDMNEFLQGQMDSKLFEGVDEKSKSEFVGNFFHFIKCRFNDCNLVQTKAEIKTAEASQPASHHTAEEEKTDLKNWASGKGNHVPAHSEGDKEYVQTAPADEKKDEKKVVAAEVTKEEKKEEKPAEEKKEKA